jgi:DNA-binding NarL/FixJ family response regulator
MEKKPSNTRVVLHLGYQDLDETFVFEDISNKLNFHPCRLTGLDDLLSYLTSTGHPPMMVALRDSIVNELSIYPTSQIENSQETNFKSIVSAIKLILQSRFADDITKIAILVENTVTREKIKFWKSAGINGILPTATEFSFHVSLKAYQDLIELGESWPQEVVEKSSRRGSDMKKVANADGIDLTDRQSQVRDLLCERGLSNKAIARQLNISESTVKIHVGSILKRYGVRNRTQLALAVNNGARL